jgi:hypothetical protein
MNSETINKYQIKFTNRVLDFGKYGKEIRKTMNINHHTLGEFLTCWDNPDDLTNYLIPDIDDILNGHQSEIINGSETITINLRSDWVTFYIDGVGTNYPEINTNDFREIVEGWRDFLLQPPLNNTKCNPLL